MAIDIKSLGLGAVDSGAVIQGIIKNSAFMALGREINIPEGGASVTLLSDIEGQGVGEGEAKVASGSVTGVPVARNKFHATVVETEEAYRVDPETGENRFLTEAIWTELPSAIAKKFDLYVAGIATLPALFSNFGTFAGVQEAEIAEGNAASASFDEAQGLLSEGVVNGVVLSTTMLNYLKRQRITTGVRAFEISGDWASGTIEGFPYVTFISSQKVGFVGNWNNYVYGNAPFVSPITGSAYRVKDSGSISDRNGVTHNLTSENKVALQYETFGGSGIADLSSFVKIVPSAS